MEAARSAQADNSRNINVICLLAASGIGNDIAFDELSKVLIYFRIKPGFLFARHFY
jgi:hypothetical protein